MSSSSKVLSFHNVEPKYYNSKCSFCFSEPHKLKLCSRCKMVRYCSKECQKAAWSSHRHRCSKTLRESLAKDPEADLIHTALGKWIDFWRGTIYNFALWSMDLANHPNDRLATHWFVIEVAPRVLTNSKTTTRSQSFEMIGGRILNATQVLALLHDMDCSEQQVTQWSTDRRGNDTVQMIIVCESLLRFIWYSLMEEAIRDERADPLLSRLFAEDWEDKLIDVIESGSEQRTRYHRLAAAKKAHHPP